MSKDQSIPYLLWALSLDSASFYGAYGNQKLIREYDALMSLSTVEDISDEILFGVKEFENKEVLERIKIYVNQVMGVESILTFYLRKPDLYNASSETVTAINHQMMQLHKYSYRSLKEMASSKDKNIKSKGKYYQGLSNYLYEWERDTFYIYQLANCIALTRLVGYLEIISRESVIKIVLEIAQIIEGLCTNYAAYGKKTAIAYAVDYATRKENENTHKFKYERNRLSHAYYTVWSKLLWAGGVENDV